MAKSDEISATMAAALAFAHEHGGELVRHAGGFWTCRNVQWHSRGCPKDDWFGASTVNSLVKRGRMEFTEWKEGRGFKFPIAARIAADAHVGEKQQ